MVIASKVICLTLFLPVKKNQVKRDTGLIEREN